MEPRIYIAPEPFQLETGHTLPELKIAYHTYGELNAAHDNVVWVCHALTANSDVADWWPHTIETGKFLDPARHFVVCANILGSHYGTTGPLHTNPQTGTPYYRDFPPFTIRDIGLLTYRGSLGYNLTQQDREELPAVHRASSYQQYQGEKLCRRYNAYSYYAILNAFDTHDAGRGRGGVAAALSRIAARTIVVGITTDIIFTPAEMRELQGMIAGSVYHEIDSPFGHDGFLVEHEQLNDILRPFMNNE